MPWFNLRHGFSFFPDDTGPSGKIGLRRSKKKKSARNFHPQELAIALRPMRTYTPRSSFSFRLLSTVPRSARLHASGIRLRTGTSAQRKLSPDLIHPPSRAVGRFYRRPHCRTNAAIPMLTKSVNHTWSLNRIARRSREIWGSIKCYGTRAASPGCIGNDSAYPDYSSVIEISSSLRAFVVNVVLAR